MPTAQSNAISSQSATRFLERGASFGDHRQMSVSTSISKLALFTKKGFYRCGCHLIHRVVIFLLLYNKKGLPSFCCKCVAVLLIRVTFVHLGNVSKYPTFCSLEAIINCLAFISTLAACSTSVQLVDQRVRWKLGP